MKIFVLSFLFLAGITAMQAAYHPPHTHVPVALIEGGPMHCNDCGKKIVPYVFNNSVITIKSDGTILVVRNKQCARKIKKERARSGRKNSLICDEVLSDEE